MNGPSTAPPLGPLARSCTSISARVPSVFSFASLIPLQKLPKAIHGTPASSTMMLGSIAFQSSLAEPMFEQRTLPLSVHVPLSRAVRVACPMHDLLLPNEDTA